MEEPGPHADRTPPPAGARRPLSRRGLAVVAALGAFGALAAGGCTREPTTEEVGALSPEAFVEIIVELREAERAAVVEDSADVVFAARKEEILAERGVTEEDVRDFVRLHEGDFELMDALWDTIAQRLKYVPDADDPEPDLRIQRRR